MGIREEDSKARSEGGLGAIRVNMRAVRMEREVRKEVGTEDGRGNSRLRSIREDRSTYKKEGE